MAKKPDTRSRKVPRDAKTGQFVLQRQRKAGGAELWGVRSADGRLIDTVTTNPASAASMDRAVKRYARALKRLAKR